MTKGTYTKDFYIIPTFIFHNGDFHKSLEFAWLKWYIGFCWKKKYSCEVTGVYTDKRSGLTIKKIN